MIKIRKLTITNLFLALIILSACASYNSSFSCGDARGARCRSMDMVDLMISNGEIIRYTEKNYNLKKKEQEEGGLKEIPETINKKDGYYLYP